MIPDERRFVRGFSPCRLRTQSNVKPAAYIEGIIWHDYSYLVLTDGLPPFPSCPSPHSCLRKETGQMGEERHWGHVPSERDTEGPSRPRIPWTCPVTFKRGGAKKEAAFAYYVLQKIIYLGPIRCPAMYVRWSQNQQLLSVLFWANQLS